FGARTADAIDAYRQKVGKLIYLEDLRNIRGVGRKELEKMRPYIELPSRPSEIDLDTASAREIEEVLYISPELAEEIVRYRSTGGVLKFADDLGAVPGMTTSTLNRIRSRVKLPSPSIGPRSVDPNTASIGELIAAGATIGQAREIDLHRQSKSFR